MARYSRRKRSYAAKKKTYKKRSVRRRKTWGTKSTKYPGFPKNRMVKMRYVEAFSQSLNTPGSRLEYVFRANSIFDPRYALGGHQPIGYDQWESFYGQYVVVGSKMMVDVSYNGGVSKVTTAMVNLTRSATDTRSLTEKLETGDTTYRILPGNAAFAARPTRVSRSFSSKKFFNRKDILDNWDDLGADFGSNPAEEAFFNFTLQATDEGETSGDGLVQGLITIEYIVLLGDPKILPQS